MALLALALGACAADDASQALYEAFNSLHTLSRSLPGTSISVPGIAVVGRQTDGKSALIEALMGFQFNQVGGGTKTRRPVALRMQYNPKCTTPQCFLQGDDGVEVRQAEEPRR